MEVPMKFFQFFTTMDQKILDCLESLCHQQQRFTGVSHYSWVRYNEIFWCIIMAFGCVYEDSSVRYLLGFISVYFGCRAAFYLPWWEQQTLVRLQKKLANPQRINEYYAGLRQLCYSNVTICLFIPVTLIPLSILRYNEFSPNMFGLFVLLALSFPVAVASYVSGLVLTACDPLPPTTGKLKEWLQSLGRQRAPSLT